MRFSTLPRSRPRICSSIIHASVAARNLSMRRVNGTRSKVNDCLGNVPGPACHTHVVSILSEIAEHKVHVIAPDIGGGFGNKVGVYPGYVCAIVASIVSVSQ